MVSERYKEEGFLGTLGLEVSSPGFLAASHISQTRPCRSLQPEIAKRYRHPKKISKKNLFLLVKISGKGWPNNRKHFWQSTLIKPNTSGKSTPYIHSHSFSKANRGADFYLPTSPTTSPPSPTTQGHQTVVLQSPHPVMRLGQAGRDSSDCHLDKSGKILIPLPG